MNNREIHQTPEAATDISKLATDFNTGGLQEMSWMLAYTKLCRRSIANLLKKGLPHVKLGRRILFHPPSVERWFLSKQRGGE